MLSVTIGLLIGGFLISLFQHWVNSSQWANHSMKYCLLDPEDERTMILWITVNYLLSDTFWNTDIFSNTVVSTSNLIQFIGYVCWQMN